MNDQDSLKPFLARVANGDSLDVAQATAAFEVMISGAATPAQIGAFLMGLRVRGETVDEITGGALAMRSRARTIEAPPEAMDIVGTGGDLEGTFNVSTAAALVVAACGVPVAKHGNRAISSRCGSADVLAALGVNLDAGDEGIRRALWEAGICFMFAPRHHGAMRNVAGPRREIGVRTVFNILGPLANPAGVTRMLVGVYDPDWLTPIATVLGNLGVDRAWVVHGEDGIDEITTAGTTLVAELDAGEVRRFSIAPEDAGLARAKPADLLGGEAETNARAINDLLSGETGPFRDIVILNASAALIVAGKVRSLAEGVARSAEAIDGGAAREKLKRLVHLSNRDDGE